MNNKDDKKKQQQLERQQAEDRRLWLQMMQKAQEPSELQKRREGQALRWFDWEESKGEFEGKPLDVTNAPNLGPAMALYEKAKAGEMGERQGQGLITMGLNATDPALAAKLAEQSKARREVEAAGNLESAVAMGAAEARGSSLPLIQLSQARDMGLAGMAGGQSANSTGQWAQFRVRPSAWANMLNHAAQGAGQAAMMFV